MALRIATIIGLCLVTLVQSQSSCPSTDGPFVGSFDFANFTVADLSCLSTPGAERISDDATFVLTYDIAPTAAGVYYKNPLLIRGFEVTFNFFITTSPTQSGNEGITFIIQSYAEGALGGQSAALGYTAPYQQTGGIPQSFVVEFDCTQELSVNDPPQDHVSVHSLFDSTEGNSPEEGGPATSWCTNGLNTNVGLMRNPLGFFGRIRYEPAYYNATANALGLLSVWVRDLPNPIITCPVNIEATLSGTPITSAWLGFTASTNSTASEGDSQYIENWTYQFLGVPTPGASTVTVSSSIVAGQSGQIFVTTYDQYGNEYLLGGQNVSGFVYKGNQQFYDIPPFEDNDNGTYLSTFTMTSAAKNAYTVQLTMNGDPIPISLPITVNPAGIAPRLSKVTSGSLAATALAGTTTSATVSTYDQYNNPLLVGNANVAVVGVSKSQWSVAAGTTIGTYVVTVCVNVIGTYRIYMTINGFNMTGNPSYLYTVKAAALSPSNSVLAWVTQSYVAGNSNQLTIDTFDSFDNVITQGGAVVSATGFPDGAFSFTDNNDGTYTVQFTLTVATNYSIVLSIANAAQKVPAGPVPDGAFAFVLAPNPVSAAATSSASGLGLVSPVAGSNSFLVQARDQYKNIVQNYNASVIMTITATNGAAFTPTISIVPSNGPGLFLVTYTVTLADTFSISVSMNGDVVGNSGFPVTVTIVPAPLSAVNCDASGIGLIHGLTNKTSTVYVATYDQYKNPLGKGGNIIEGIMSFPALNLVVNATVVDQNNGSYSVSYFVPHTGDYTFAITANGTAIAGSPFLVSIGWAKLIDVIIGVVAGLGVLAACLFGILYWRVRSKKDGFVRL